MNTQSGRRRTLSAALLVLTALALLALVGVAAPSPAEAAAFPTYYANGEDGATWLDGAGRLQAAWTSESGTQYSEAVDLLIVRHTLDGAADPSWGTDPLTGAAGVRRVALQRPSIVQGSIVHVDALGADDAGNITIAWDVSWTDTRGTQDIDDDIGISEAVIDRYTPDGSRTARRTVAHYERANAGYQGRPETFISGMVSLSDGSIAAEEVTYAEYQPSAARVIWYGTAGETRASFPVDPQSTLEAASTNGDGRLYVTTDDGVLRRTSATGVESITSDCQLDQPWRGPLIPVAGPGGSFATVCGSGYSSTGTRGIRVRRYSSTGTLTSTVISTTSSANRVEVFRPTSGAFDSAGRMWVGGFACDASSGTVECYQSGGLQTAAVSAFDATQKLAGLGTASYGGYRVDGVRSVSGNRISYAAAREYFNGAKGVEVDLLPRSTAPPATVPAQPAAPTGTAGPGQVALSWTAPGNGGSPITGYRLTPYRNGVAQPAVDVGAVTSYTFTGLINGASYRFTVAARNAQGLGSASTQSTQVVPAGPPGAPTNVRAAPGAQSATVTWTAPASNGGSALTGYSVKLIANGTPLRNISTGTATSLVVQDLKSGTSYTFEVAARNAVATGPWSATSNATTPPPNAFASWPKMVDRQYQDLNGRTPTGSELFTQVDQLQSASKPAGALPAELRQSVDNINNVDPTTRLYDSYFLRIPDPGGLDYWIARKRAGTRLAVISANFANSSEFQRRYGSLTNQQFVELVYNNVLKRNGDAEGIRYWTAQLDEQRKTRGDVMVGFSESSEHVRKEQNFVTVDVLYIAMLDRAPTITELDTEATTLANGGTVTALADRIIASTEYANRIARLA